MVARAGADARPGEQDGDGSPFGCLRRLKANRSEHYGKIVGATIDGSIGDTLTRVGQMAGDLLRASNHTQEVLRKAEDARSDTLCQL